MRKYVLDETDRRILKEMVRAYLAAKQAKGAGEPRRRRAEPEAFNRMIPCAIFASGSDWDCREIGASAAADDTAIVYGDAVSAVRDSAAVGIGYWNAAGSFVLWDAGAGATLTVTEAGAAPTNKITAALMRAGANRGELSLVGDDYGGVAGDQIIGVVDQGSGIVEIVHWDANTYAPAVTTVDLQGPRYLHFDRAGHLLGQDNTP